MFTLLRSLGLFGFLRLSVFFIISKCLFPKARIIRLPFYIRNQGRFLYGRGFSSNPGLVIDIYGANSVLSIGSNFFANYRLHIGVCASVSIGDNNLFGSDCLIIDHSHGGYGNGVHSHPSVPPQFRELKASPIFIGSNCWFGDRVSVLPGVNIGDGVVVGVGSVVTSDLPSHCVAVGSPAKVIKVFNTDTSCWEKIHELP